MNVVKQIAIVIFFCMVLPQLSFGALWKVSGKIGFTLFDGQMNEHGETTTVLLRLENGSQTESLEIDEHFIQLMDQDKKRMRPISADEIISEKLEELYKIMPQHAKDIDEKRQAIQADFPQEKIVKVYAMLKTYLKQGKPIQWRAALENFLLGTKASSQKDSQKAKAIIEEIGKLSENYFWPGNIPPGGSRTGLLFFKKPLKLPPMLYLKSGDQFLGMPFEIVSSKDNS